MKSSSSFWDKLSPVRIPTTVTATFLLALLSLVVVPGGSSPAKASTPPPLRATLQLIGQAYCVSGEDQAIGNADFQLHVQIHNEGKRPVILCRKYTGVWTPVLHNVNSDGSVGDLADKMEPHTFGLFDKDYPTDLKDYEVIQPGQSFDLDATTGIFFRVPPNRNVPLSAPDPGSYFLKVELRTWGGPPGAPAKLRRQWRHYGYLFDGFIESDPIPVRITPPADLATCRF